MLLVDVDDDRWLDEVARAEACAATGDRGTQFAAEVDVAADAVLLLGGDQWAHLHTRVQTVAQLHAVGDASDVGDHVVEVLAVHIEARAGAAHLALVEEYGGGGTGSSLLQVGVGHDDGG
ncbi:hypothetical protein D3C84_537240 [compost metagenome]